MTCRYAYLFAGLAAGSLGYAHGWLAWHHRFYHASPTELSLCVVPGLLVALVTYLVRKVGAAVWLTTWFAGVLAAWSVLAARAGTRSEGVGIIGLERFPFE